MLTKNNTVALPGGLQDRVAALAAGLSAESATLPTKAL
jgi:hypothetical protein